VDLRNRFVSQISRAEILDLVAQRTPEDDHLEFKRELLNSKKAPRALDDEKEDFLADLVAFANTAGGLILVGIEEDPQGRASGLAPITGDEARKLANAIRDLAVAHIKPGTINLEVVPFQMRDDGSEWIVVVRVPEGIDRPYMSRYRDQTWMSFTMRAGSRKRAMAYEEIKQGFLSDPQQTRIAQILGEIESIKSLLSDIGTKLER